MSEQKICPLLASVPLGAKPDCLGDRCAWACHQWNDRGDQVNCSTYVCALKVLAETLEHLTGHATGELYCKEDTP